MKMGELDLILDTDGGVASWSFLQNLLEESNEHHTNQH